MSDIEIKLEPQDEYNHEPDEASNYNESMYFNVFDHNKQMGGWFRLGNRPNEGYAEMTCCIYLPDGRIGFMFGRPSKHKTYSSIRKIDAACHLSISFIWSITQSKPTAHLFVMIKDIEVHTFVVIRGLIRFMIVFILWF